jgi:DNA-binding NarL/FixJ family response regulator
VKTKSNRARIFLVDDHPIIRRGLASMINQEPDLAVCGEAAGLPGTVDAVRRAKPDLVIIDLVLEASSGLDLIRQLKSQLPALPLLVLSMHPENTYAERVLRAGASGYIMKQEPSETVLAALRCVLKGGLFLSETIKERLLQRLTENPNHQQRYSIDCLSNREVEILRMIGSGWSTRQIAEKLKGSVKTIDAHRANIKTKLHLRSGAELVQYAIQWNQGENGR